MDRAETVANLMIQAKKAFEEAGLSSDFEHALVAWPSGPLMIVPMIDSQGYQVPALIPTGDEYTTDDFADENWLKILEIYNRQISEG